METLNTLSKDWLNSGYIEKHGITAEDVRKINFTISILEQERFNATVPIIGDTIICTTPDKLENPNFPIGHLDSPLENEFASICVCPSGAPFVFHDGHKITKFSCSGGYWTAEQDIGMFEYILSMEEKIFCQWGHCGMAHSGAIYFHARVNVWRLVRENLN